MSYVVWKFALDFHTEQSVELPYGAEVLRVGEQNDRIVVWARCHPEAPKQPRRFYVVGTGADIPDAATHYRGTVQIHEPGWPELVLHVFEGDRT